MTQQINLYQPEEKPSLGPIAIPLVVLVIVAIVLLGYWQMLRTSNDTWRVTAKQLEAQVVAERAAVKEKKDQLTARQDPARLNEELAALRSMAAEAQAIVARIEKGELGTLKGFAGQLTTLARISEDGVWLTGVRIQNAGQSIAIDGRSLRSDSVLKYAENLNRQMATYGARVEGLEVTPLALEASGSPQPAVAFKLY